MQNRIFTSAFLAAVATVALLAPVQPAHAMTAEQYFADANRLFRDDLYWAALRRYQQASEAGLDTPLLHYNTGIAHYRANQHIRARESLLRALDDPTLRVAAQYNLGLNAYALGETEEALRWFRLVRDQNENQTLQRFAVIAISRIRVAQEEPAAPEERPVKTEQEREFTNLELLGVRRLRQRHQCFPFARSAVYRLFEPQPATCGSGCAKRWLHSCHAWCQVPD